VVLVYISGQLIGFLGAVGCWFAYKAALRCGTGTITSGGVSPFRTGDPAAGCVITEVIGTFVLVFTVVISFGQRPRCSNSRGPLPDLLP
jgi:glycerol uptake facilitator-like aquaporin